VYCKGAPDMVIKLCTEFIGEGGVKMELSEDKKEWIAKEILLNFAN